MTNILRRTTAAVLSAVMVLSLCLFTGCSESAKYEKYNDTFIDYFDTIISVASYHKSPAEHASFKQALKEEYSRLNQLYDIYNSYEGINNAKTINDNAGIAPVKVEEDLFDLVKFSLEWYHKTEGRVNVAMGSVLKIWHNVRTAAEGGYAALPAIEKLEKANEHTSIENIVLDEANMTVYITDPDASLDLGAVAKGYATELIADKLGETYPSFAISAGGNVKVHGSPMDGRTRWGVGITNPIVDENFSMAGGNIDLAYVAGDATIVCSGGYQRFIVVDGKRYHHLIDPQTLFPNNTYHGVTILCEDSGVADVLSTAIFMMEKDDALAFINTIDNTECMLVTIDGKVYKTEGFNKYLESCGINSKTPVE